MSIGPGKVALAAAPGDVEGIEMSDDTRTRRGERQTEQRAAAGQHQAFREQLRVLFVDLYALSTGSRSASRLTRGKRKSTEAWPRQWPVTCGCPAGTNVD
jgi:hypothetical protein